MTANKLLLIAGEISSDRYASEVCQSIHHIDPDIHITAFAGQKTQAHCDHFAGDILYDHAMGPLENWQKRHHVDSVVQKVSAYIHTHTVDAVVIIDYPHVNFKLAPLFQAAHIPIITFITPNFWIWGDKKSARKLARYSHRIISIFEKEFRFYQSLGANVGYFGHPLPDLITAVQRQPSTPKKIVLMPGSRDPEINYHLPTMLNTIQILRQRIPDLDIQIAASSPRFHAQIQGILDQHQLSDLPITDDTQSCFESASLLISVAGTVTLEAIIHRLPIIVVGRVSWISYCIGRFILRLQLASITLPNIVMNAPIIPEFIQYDMKPEKMAESAEHLLNPQHAETLISQYDAILKTVKKTEHPMSHIAQDIIDNLRQV